MQWLLENVFISEQFVETFSKRDHKLIEPRAYFDIKELYQYYPENACVLFIGSLDVARRIKQSINWFPGAYYNIDAFDCIDYYPAFGNHLLNARYLMMPYGDLIRQKEFLFESFGSDRTIFVRPNSGGKSFTGTLIYKEKFEEDVSRLGYGDVASDELVVVSSPTNLEKEWRFIVVNGEAITGSQYKENHRISIAPGYPKEAIEFANSMAKCYNPDPAWVLDVCLTKSKEFKVVEIGCFSCAGLYACDLDKIIEIVEPLAIKDWEEMNVQNMC